jgi:hypothetical protein
MKSYSAMTVQGHGSVKVTPSNETVFDPPSRGLWIGTAGNISVTFPDGTTAVDMPAIEGYFPFYVTMVNTGSSAAVADNIWTVV